MTDSEMAAILNAAYAATFFTAESVARQPRATEQLTGKTYVRGPDAWREETPEEYRLFRARKRNAQAAADYERARRDADKAAFKDALEREMSL